MKILIMVHNLTGGGAERVAALWASGFVERGYEVGMVLNCSEDTPMTYQVPKKVHFYNLYGNKTVNLIAGILSRRLHNFWYYVGRMKRILNDFKPDVVIGVLQPYAEWARIASIKKPIVVINTEHNSFERPDSAPMGDYEWEQKYKWNVKYEQVTVLNNADKICTRDFLDNVTVLPNPLAFLPAYKPEKKEKVILAAGRLDVWHCKGFDIMLKVWGLVAPEFPEWRLEIAGKGTEQDVMRIEKMMIENRVKDRTCIIGYQTDMIPVYQRSSVFLLTSRYEGFGMVLIEAMSQGAAPIACDYKGRQSEIITNENEGILTEPEDVVSIADGLRKLLSDDALRIRIQKNAVERSKYYSLENIMDRWEEIFKRISIKQA